MNPIGGQTPSNMIIALFLLACSGLGHSATSNNHQSTNLFDGDRNVISLNGTSFEAAVLNQKHITICAFYSHWCSHCQRKMPIISELAKSIKSWKEVVQIAGVNAAINYKLARKVNVDYYPKFYYFPAKTLELDQIRPLNLAPTSQDKLKKIVLDLIKKDNILLQLYSLNPILVYQKSDLCSMLSDVDRSIEQFIIVERQPSNFSLMLFLELMPYKDTMQIRRIYGDDHLLQSLVTSPIDKIAILRMGQGSCSFELFMMNPNQEIDAVKSKFSPFIHADSEEINNEIVPENNAVAKKVVRCKLSYVDLYNALRHALLIEVPMVTVFNEKQVRVLKQFICRRHFR